MSQISVLVISTHYPGYGGAGTNSYAIIKYLRSKSYNTIGLFVDDNSKVDIDPDKVGDIIRFPLRSYEENNLDDITRCRDIIVDLNNGTEPSIILCKNYLAPCLSKMFFPSSKNIYLVSGITEEIDICNEVSQEDFTVIFHRELSAIYNSDLIVLNSPISLDKFIRLYGSHKVYPKPVDTTKYIEMLIENNKGVIPVKKYDFLITSSILTRKEKNNIFLIDILKEPVFDKYIKLVVGNDNVDFQDIPNCFVYNLMPHSILMDLMSKTKVLLCPSLSDSNPNTVREALHNKCLVLASKNIGYAEAFAPISICDTYDKTEWIDKSIYLVEKYHTIIDSYEIEFDDKGVDLVDVIDNLLD